MNLGEILDRTFQIYKSRFLLFLTVAALPAVAIMTIEFANIFWWHIYLHNSRRSVFGLTLGDLTSMLAYYQISLLLHMLVWPVSAILASKAYLGEQSTLRDALASCLARWRSVIAIATALWALVLVVPELFCLALLIGSGELLWQVLKLDSPMLDRISPFVDVFAGWALILGLGTPFLFAIPVWALEGKPVRAAIRRGWAISRTTRFRAVFVRVITPVLAMLLRYLLVFLPFLFFTFVFRGVGGRGFFSRHLLVFNMVAVTVAQSLAAPVFSIALSLFYYDQRIRKEGFDIERMMETAGMNLAATSDVDFGSVAQAGVEEGQA